jgi:WD40 repeat protein
VTFSADGEFLLSASNDRTIRVWLLPEGRLVSTLSGHTSAVQALAVIPDGRLLASGGDDKTIRLWSLPDGRPIRAIEAHTDTVSALAISPEGYRLVSAGRDRAIRIWWLADLRVDTITGHTDAIHAVAISPNGQLLASAGADRTVRLWSFPEGEALATCLLDVGSSPSTARGVQYRVGTTTYTLPCGSPIPPGASCVCNCVWGWGPPVCSCQAYSPCTCHTYTPCTCQSQTTTRPCPCPPQVVYVPPGYRCVCNCIT